MRSSQGQLPAQSSDPKSTVEYWQSKFESNVERDRRNRRNQDQPIRDGWRVFVAWESEVETDDMLIARLADSPRCKHSRPGLRSGVVNCADARPVSCC